MKFKSLFSLVVVVLVVVATVNADLANFEETSLAPESHYGGANSGVNTGFTSGDAYFDHTSDAYSWSGFSYSNETDTTTAGYTNQFSAYVTDGDGHAYTAGDNQYGVCYVPNDWQNGYAQIPQTLSLGAVSGNDYDKTVSGMWVTNTTYAYLSMSGGDQYARPFTASDWFRLTIKGITNTGSYTNNVVDFYLADFTAGNSIIVDQWTWVDLSSLGNVVGLEFNLTSSDVGQWGINTPSYFAMDNFNGSALQAPVPEPMTIALLGLGSVLIRKRKINKENYTLEGSKCPRIKL